MSVRDTSRQSYIYIRTTGIAINQYTRIVGLLKRFKNGLTIAEMAEKTGFQKSSVAARYREMLDAKIIKEMPKRKQQTGGCLARPVALRSFL